MKRIPYLLLALLALPIFMACNEDDTIDYTEYYNWRDQNNLLTLAFENAISTDSANTYFNNRVFSLQESHGFPGNAGSQPQLFPCTFYHVVHHANLDSLRALTPRKDYRPFATSTVSVHYTLFKTKSVMERIDALTQVSSKTYDESVKDVLHTASAMDSIFFANAYDSPLKADTIESNQVTFFSCTPNGVISGWGDMLQQMYIGDHVVCMIPWFLAYGQSGSGSSIDPYSNLFFRIELCDITSWGATVERKEGE